MHRRRSPRSSWRSSEGTTLIELVIVLMLLGVVSAVVGPRFFGALAGDIGDDLFLQEVLGSLRYAQKLSMGSGCRVQVDFTASGVALTQETGCAGGVFGLAVRDPATGDTPYARNAPPGIAIASTVDPITFDALGRATDGGTVSDAAITVGGRSLSVAGGERICLGAVTRPA